MFINKRLLRLIHQVRPVFLLTVLFSLLAAVMIILQARILSSVISRVYLGGQTLEDISPQLLYLVIILVLRAMAVMGSELSAGAVAAKIKSKLRILLFQRLVESGSGQAGKYQSNGVNSRFTENDIDTMERSQGQEQETGEMVSVVLQGVDALDSYFSQYIPQLLLAVLVPVLILLSVFPLEWLSGVILLFTLPLIPFFMILIGKSAEKLTQRQWKTLSRMSAYFLDSLQGLATLKMLNQNGGRAGKIARVGDQYRRVTMNVLRITFLSAFVLELVATISTALVAVQIGLRLLYGQVEFEPAFFILVLAPEFYLPLRLLGLRFHASMSGVSAAVRIFDVLDVSHNQSHSLPSTIMPLNEAKETTVKNRIVLSPAMAVSPGMAVPPNKVARVDLNMRRPFNIAFEHVSYLYPNRQQEALQDVTFTIPSGKKTVLVGMSGSGKSTVIRLLLRLIEPSQGQITFTTLSTPGVDGGDIINSIPLHEVPDREAWRRQIAWMPQNAYLFNASFADNIRLGRPDALIEEVEAAARQAHLHEFIISLPKGYETQIGEQGARLSGGQAQRLALARAFLLDAPLLLFDEPTTSLDLETETVLVESLNLGSTMRQLALELTSVIVAHRLQTIVDAHQIIVFEKGRVVEVGKHADLVNQRGAYFHLVHAVVPGTVGGE